MLRHIASARRRVMRDEDADIDTAAGPTTASAAAAAVSGGVCNVDDDVLLKASRSRRVARPLPASYLSTGAGSVQLSLVLNFVFLGPSYKNIL